MRIRKTYLSSRPKSWAFWVSLWSSMLLALISLISWDEIPGVAPLLTAERSQVFTHHELWRLLTTIGVHADFRHLGSNVLLFSILSYALAGYFGLLVYPVLTLFLGAAANGLALLTSSNGVTIIGASGAVYVMAGFWLTMYLAIERTQTVGNRILRCIGFSLVILIPEAFDPLVSYRTHAFGFALGLAAAVPYFLLNRARFRAAEVIEPEEPPEEPPAEPQDDSNASEPRSS